MLRKYFVKNLFLILVLISFPCICAASMLTSELGKKPQYDSLRSSSGGKETIETVGIISKDPLNKKVLNKTLDGLSRNQSFVTRGVKETALYKRTSPGVVLVVTNEGLGSGVLIKKSGDILTNCHVIEGYKTVGVAFKRGQQENKISPQDIVTATVIKIDEISDLALIRVSSVPANVNPLRLGNESEIQIGADVHAIGHPTGESWTYTKGIISQIRKEYEWVTDDNKQHKADVIQTQTPINPGNSGGPLLSDSGSVIGINSFKASGEGINFAVSVTDLKRFLDSSSNKYASIKQNPSKSSQQTENCETKVLGETRSKDGISKLIFYDTDCDGTPDAYLTIPDDLKQPILLSLITKKSGKVYAVLVDEKRDGKWDYSLWDTNEDGKSDLIGYHDDGGIEPTRYEKYHE
jgi:S1-C subfamily serine protease